MKSQLTGESRTRINARMIDEDFLPRVEGFIRRHELSPTTFGFWAVNDSQFVFELRAGRRCFGTTIRRVYRFMEEYEQKQEAKRRRTAC